MTDELIVNGIYLDMTEGIPVPISYAIADAKDPSKRKQTFSKEVKLPDTVNNRAFFIGSFGFTTTENGVSFDATAKATAIVKKRGVQVLEGILKLDNVVIEDRVISFVCRVLSDNVDFFQLLSTINVGDLDWSAYNHTLNRTNIKASWTTLIGSGYYYPLIERGNGRLGATIWRTTDIVPYVYMREVLFKLCEWADIEWDSTFLDSTRFKSILFGYGGGDIKSISATDINERKIEIDNGDFEHSKTVTYHSLPINGDVQFNMQTPNFNPFADAVFTHVETQDNLDQYEDGEIEVARSGNYNLSINCSLDYAVDVGAMNFTELFGVFIAVRRNGLVLYNIFSSTSSYDTLTGTITFDVNTSRNIFLESGDTVSFTFSAGIVEVEPDDEYDPVTIDFITDGVITIDLTSIDTTVTDGATIELSNFIPIMKGSEFLLGVIRQFNLYMSDPDELTGVTDIEPLSEFYLPTSTFDDITKKIDHSKPITITPSANEFAKNIIYAFKKSTDYDATRYFDKWQEEYGDLKYIQGSYYAKGDLKTDLPWSTIIPYEVSPGILVPRFVKIENSTMKPNSGAPRIMYRNGLINGSFTLRDTVGTGSEVLTQYPCVHHFDDWTDPEFDLNFKLVNEVYYTASIVTTLNCFSEYYSTFINEMTSRAGQFVKLSVVFNEQDIKNRDFRKLLMINGGLFRLNKINEFSADVKTSTEIELIKVLKAKKKKRATFSVVSTASSVADVLTSPNGTGVGAGVLSGSPTAGQEIFIIRGN